MSKKAFIKSTFHDVEEQLGRGYDVARQELNRLTTDRLCVGITGLSRSGKSTFITSLINQLKQHEFASLGAFSAAVSGRLMAVKIHPLEDTGLTDFPYGQALSDLSATPPRWPQSTTDISGCLLELKLKNRKGVFSVFKGESRSLFIELRDYPGEWLLDLPLMDMNYAQWCAQCATQFKDEPRRGLLGDLFDELQAIDLLSDFDAEYCQRLRLRYVSFLKACKNGSASLSLIQPGRFLMPGTFEGSELLDFIPMLACGSYSQDQLKAASDNSYFKVLESRFKAYVKQVVVPFYKQFFRPINRQIVLVDVINALNGGPAYINDMRQALANLSDSFSYGRHSALANLFQPEVEQVMFVATKVDQVVSKDHEAVRQLTASLVRQAYQNAAYEGVDPVIEAVASVRSSREIIDKGDAGISGFDLDGRPVGYIHPDIPEKVPSDAEYAAFVDWKIPLLNPPQGIHPESHEAIPHIRLDSILERLVGDCCK
ncbi:MAG: YcjX family protein [Pontibacterium sp.]